MVDKGWSPRGGCGASSQSTPSPDASASSPGSLVSVLGTAWEERSSANGHSGL